MSNSKSTIVIPTTLNTGVLYSTLWELNRGVIVPDNVVVVVDYNNVTGDVNEKIQALRAWTFEKTLRYDGYVLSDTNLRDGAGDMRNMGVEFALEDLTQDVIVFLGDDCIPTEGMLLGHIKRHLNVGTTPLITQGYSPYAPEVLGTPFMAFLDKSGITASWNNLVEDDGTIRPDAQGFFLTTNVGMSMSAIEMLMGEGGKLFPAYPNAAWEDVSVGRRATALGIKTVFAQDSVVHHWHEHDPISMVRRQITEGKNRILFCVDHPETANAMLPMSQISGAIENPVDIGVLTNTMNGFNTYPFPQTKQIVEIQETIWADALQLASIYGSALSISNLVENSPTHLLQVYPHLTNEHTPMLLFSAIHAMETEDYEYVKHCAHWIYQKEGETFASHLVAGLLYTYLGEYLDAYTVLQHAVTANPASENAVLLLSHVTRKLQKGDQN